MALSLLINDVEYKHTLLKGSVSISEALQANGASMEAALYMRHSGLPVPEPGNVIKLSADGRTEFHGRITAISSQAFAGPEDIRYELDCTDFTIDLDTKLLQMKIPPSSAGEQVRAIVGGVGKGITLNNVVEGPQMLETLLDLEVPSGAITRIAESIEHQWYIDYERDVHFFFVRDLPAPVAHIDLESNISDYFEDQFRDDAANVKNVIFLTGGKASSGGGGGDPAIETFKGDGQTRFFPLGYEPEGLETTVIEVGDALTPNNNATTNWTQYIVKLDGVDSSVGDGNAEAGTVFLCIDNWGVRFPDGLDPPGGDPNDVNTDVPIRAAYDYMYEPAVQVEDQDSIAYMREREDTVTAPSDGRHEFKFTLPDIRVRDENAFVDYGNLLLSRYAYPVRMLSFKSRTQGWGAGQSLTITSSRFNVHEERFYVHSVKKSIRIMNDIMTMFEYSVEMSNSAFPG